MNKELEEAISLLKEMQDNALIACRCYKTGGVLYRDEKAEKKVNAIETVLNYIENSIPKEVIIDKILERKFELQQEYKDFEDDIQLNTLQELLEEK